MEDSRKKGRITKGVGGEYTILLDDGEYVLAKPRGIFRNKKVIPTVGDFCEVEPSGDPDIPYVIVSIGDRKNLLVRPSVANIDVLIIAVSTADPEPDLKLLDKLLILSKKLNVSIDSLLGGENTTAVSEKGKPSVAIRIISPHEGVIINASKVTRSQQFMGGKNSPKFALFASDGNDLSLWGAQNTFLAWYRNLEDVTREIAEIQTALDAGAASYTLQYSVKCKQNLLRTIED